MTQADSVHSTPRETAPKINPPVHQTRRHFLTVAAGGAVAAALPTAGLAGLPAVSAASAIPVFDTAPTALVARFELLLDEYYARRGDWGPRLAQAHAETDKLFGMPVETDDREALDRFFSEACARLDVDVAHDRLHAVGEEMKPLARAIAALPTTSLEVLRAKALVTFWEVAPLGASDTEYHFCDEYPFQLLFSAVAEFCGLAEKVSTTGYTLPELPYLFSPCSEDDDEEEA